METNLSKIEKALREEARIILEEASKNHIRNDYAILFNHLTIKEFSELMRSAEADNSFLNADNLMIDFMTQGWAWKYAPIETLQDRIFDVLLERIAKKLNQS